MMVMGMGMMMMMMMRLQTEAAALRNVMSGGKATKIIALGIGSGPDMMELRGMASPPQNRTVILVKDFNSLPTVQQQLRDQTCGGKCHSPS